MIGYLIEQELGKRSGQLANSSSRPGMADMGQLRDALAILDGKAGTLIARDAA